MIKKTNRVLVQASHSPGNNRMVTEISNDTEIYFMYSVRLK